MPTERPIVLTGTHRSGSTWAGSVLAASPRVYSVHEPFNVLCCQENFGYPNIHVWFAYPSEGQEREKIVECVRRLAGLEAAVVGWQKVMREPRRWREWLGTNLQLMRARRGHKTVLIKDPIAVFSAHWLARSLNARILHITRHPAAFVASVKKAGWECGYHTLAQRIPLGKLGGPGAIEDLAKLSPKHDFIERAALFWKLVQRIAYQRQQAQEKGMVFVRHEDLSREPVCAFRSLCRDLDIDYCAEIDDEIRRTTEGSGESGLIRDSQANIGTWRTRLDSGEIDRIMELTYPVWSWYYSEDDWRR